MNLAHLGHGAGHKKAQGVVEDADAVGAVVICDRAALRHQQDVQGGVREQLHLGRQRVCAHQLRPLLLACRCAALGTLMRLLPLLA